MLQLRRLMAALLGAASVGAHVGAAYQPARVGAAGVTFHASEPPVIFWNSEAGQPGTTVMAMGGGLAGASVQLADAHGSTALAAPDGVDAWDGSIKFLLPEAGPTAAYRFRACAAGSTAACGAWRTVNVPAVMWAVGDASRRREFCHCADTPSPSLLEHLLKEEGGAAE